MILAMSVQTTAYIRLYSFLSHFREKKEAGFGSHPRNAGRERERLSLYDVITGKRHCRFANSFLDYSSRTFS